MTKQKLSEENRAFFSKAKKYRILMGLKWTKDTQEFYENFIDEQRVFETARQDLKNCFGLELSLGQQVELRRFHVPLALSEYKRFWYAAGSMPEPEREAAARFMLNNFSITLENIERALNFCPLEKYDYTAYRWLQHQQYELLKI